jgi:hypothetical protein
MRRIPSTRKNFTVHRERDVRALTRLALLLGCGLVLAGGFVFAAGQHFAAVQYGYQSETLRQEQAALLEEQQRLLLERERATAPDHLGAAAREIGMQPVRPEQITPARSLENPRVRTAPAFVSPSAALGR